MIEHGATRLEDAKAAAKAAKNAYQRAWCRKNPDKVREYREAYWMRRCLREQAAKAGGDT